MPLPINIHEILKGHFVEWERLDMTGSIQAIDHLPDLVKEKKDR